MSDSENDWQERTRLLYGAERTERFRQARVLVVGLGGVGAYAAEMLGRTGIGNLTLVDADVVEPTNLNRQLPALHSTLGKAKAEVMAERLRDINPKVELTVLNEFLDEQRIKEVLKVDRYDFVVDAIDSVRPKCTLIEECLDLNVPVVSAMGAGAKVDIRRIQLADIWMTRECRLARTVRSYLRKDGYARRRLPVVYSDETVLRSAVITVEGERNKKSTAGTAAYITATFGNYLAWYVLEHL